MASLGTPPNTNATEPPAGGRIPTWGLGDAAAGWLAAYTASIVVGAAILAAIGYHQGDDLTLGIIALTYPPLWLGFVGAPVWAAKTKGNGWRRDFGGYLVWRDVPVGIGAGVATQLILVPLVSLPILLLTDQTSDDLTRPARELADKAVGGWGAVLFFVIVGLCAPVAEELFFRGLVLRAIEKRLAPRRQATVLAVVLSSVLFGATHFQALQFLGLFTAGLVFGALTVRSGRLGPAVVAHMAFNTTAVIALLSTGGS